MKPQTRLLLQLVGVTVAMGAASFAAVPLYDIFCRVTGFAGTPAVASQASDVVLDRVMRVRFDASLENGMPWRFKPAQRSMDIRIGETGLAFYEAHNPTGQVIAGTASFNVTPDSAGGYFTKIDCFCFTQQVLQPGETMMMPVTFFVDPDIIRDKDAKYLKELTLSYTFHTTELPGDQAALEPPPPTTAAN